MDAALDKKAQDVVALKVGPFLHLTDYFVIASVDNPRQMKAVVDDVERKLRKEYSCKALSTEGFDNPNWALIDYGDFVVHIFDKSARDDYRLEGLWAEAEKIYPKEVINDPKNN